MNSIMRNQLAPHARVIWFRGEHKPLEFQLVSRAWPPSLVSCVPSNEVGGQRPEADVVDSDPEASAAFAAGGKGKGPAGKGKGPDATGKKPVKKRRKVQTLTHNTSKAG
jgi:hypothetical protein